MKAWSVMGLLFAAAIFATIPISAPVTPRGLELSVDGAKAITYGHARQFNGGWRGAISVKSDVLSVAACTDPVRSQRRYSEIGERLLEGLPSVARGPQAVCCAAEHHPSKKC